MPSVDRIKARLTEPPSLAPPAAPFLPPVQRGQPVCHRSFSQNGALVQRHGPAPTVRTPPTASPNGVAGEKKRTTCTSLGNEGSVFQLKCRSWRRYVNVARYARLLSAKRYTGVHQRRRTRREAVSTMTRRFSRAGKQTELWGLPIMRGEVATVFPPGGRPSPAGERVHRVHSWVAVLGQI